MLVAALLGIGLSALLLNKLAHTAPRDQVPLVIGCIIAGTLACDLADYAYAAGSGHPWLPPVTQLFYVGLIVLTVAIRLRQSAR